MRPSAKPGVKGFQRAPREPAGTVERVAQIVVRLRSIERCRRRRPGSFKTAEKLRLEQMELRKELFTIPQDVVTLGRELERSRRSYS